MHKYSKENHAFGLALLKFRKLRQLNQPQIAKLLMVTAQTIGKWENGLSAPPYAEAVKIGKLLGFSMEEVDTILMELEAT